MGIPRFVRVLVSIGISFLLIWFFVRVRHADIRIGETLLLIAAGFVVGCGACSFLSDPDEFRDALSERFGYVFSFVRILLIRIESMLVSLPLRIFRISVALILSLVYGISPIDLIPDVIPVVGWMDDIAVFLLLLYWALFLGRFAVTEKYRERIREIRYSRMIITKFP